MPIKEYSSGLTVKGNPKIWRYMDFPKFVSMVESSSLFFPNMSYFKKNYDHKEGVWPFLLMWKEEWNKEVKRNFIDPMAQTIDKFIPLIHINCWHMNENESMAMWDLYSFRNQGIAIQSTYERLYAVLDPCTIEMNFLPIQYTTYDFESITKIQRLKKDEIKWSCALKDKSYEHEKELRIIFNRIEIQEGKIYAPEISIGLPIKIDLKKLIECVYIHPKSSIWYQRVIKSLLEKYNIDIPVKQSQQ